MVPRRTLVVTAFLFLAIVSSGQQGSDLQQRTAQLASSVFTGPSMGTLRELTDGFGGRLTGSASYDRSTEWAAAKFRSFGIANVRRELFPIPNGWQRGLARGQMIAPLQRPLYLQSLGWTPSTPAGGVNGEVVLVSDISSENIKAHAGDLKGRIVLLDTEKIFADGFRKAFAQLHLSYPLLKDAGALAVLYPDRAPNNVLNATDADWGAAVKALPVAQLGMEDAKLVRRLLERGPVKLAFELQNQITGPTQVSNVIAEIRGSERPDEWILIGAHLDSWDYGTGAQDNGTGTAMVLEAARALALGKPPRRSLRFALWGGEEQGLLGSTAYVAAHAQELANCVAVLNADNGAGHPKGWKVQGRKDLQEALQPLSKSLLGDLIGGEISLEVTYDTDHGPFMLQGIPSLDLLVDMAHYAEVHHKASDTYDKVDGLDFKAGAALLTVTAYAIAQADQPIAPHLDHAAVGEILKKAALDQFLVDMGIWKP